MAAQKKKKKKHHTYFTWVVLFPQQRCSVSVVLLASAETKYNRITRSQILGVGLARVGLSFKILNPNATSYSVMLGLS